MTADELLLYIEMNCDAVKRLEKPLIADEAAKLLAQYGERDVVDMLNKMNNYKPLRSKYRSAYQTCLKWFKLDIDKGYLKPAAIAPTHQSESELNKEKFLRKYPVGSEFTTVSGRKYKVLNDTFVQSENGGCTPIVQFIFNNH